MLSVEKTVEKVAVQILLVYHQTDHNVIVSEICGGVGRIRVN